MKDDFEPDFAVTMRLRNNHMLAWREERGLSARAASDLAGICYSTWLNLESLRCPPTTKGTGRLKTVAKKVADLIDMSPEDIWTDVIRAVRYPVVQRKLTGGEVLAFARAVGPRLLPTPEEFADSALIKQRLYDSMARRLSPRCQRILTLRWGLDGQGERTLEEVAEIMGIRRSAVSWHERHGRWILNGTTKLRKQFWDQ